MSYVLGEGDNPSNSIAGRGEPRLPPPRHISRDVMAIDDDVRGKGLKTLQRKRDKPK